MGKALFMRIDISAQEVTKALSEFLATGASEEPIEAHQLATRHDVLPIWNDWVGCIALRPSGELVFVPWEEPNTVESIPDTPQDRVMVHAARAVGGRRFPSISGLTPTRDAKAQECPTCNGVGRPPNIPENVICQCGGLGWISDIHGAA
jgi:hypothetical protein